MKILITGTSNGIGRASAEKFLASGFEVYGLDVVPQTIKHPKFHGFTANVADLNQLPDIDEVDVVINNAATKVEEDAIEVNLVGYVNVVNKYALQPNIKCVINIGSISGRTGFDDPLYSAAMGGRISYTKHLAMQLGNEYKARAICLSFGAVHTNLEPDLYAVSELMEAVANENLLKKWITPEEAAEWVYFLAVVDTSCTGQDILIDSGEEANFNFISTQNTNTKSN